MKVYAPQQAQPQKQSPQPGRHARAAHGSRATRASSRADAEGREAAAGALARPRLAHDFSRIPVHPVTPFNLQTKLTVNAPGDAYEQEADRVAERVMRMPEPRLQRACACGGGCPGCKQDARERLQTKRVRADDVAETAAPPIVHEVLRSPGRPLDASTREFMETRFGHDFGRVRVHTDAHAAESAGELNALAYTVGSNVVFGAGRYRPETAEGRRLLAHELTHTLQQSNGFQNGPATGPIQRQASGAKAVEAKDRLDGGGAGDGGGGKTFDLKSVRSDLNELHGLKVSGTEFSVASDAQKLSGAIKTLRSLTQRTDKLSVSQPSAQKIVSKVSALNKSLTPAASQLGVEGQKGLLVGVTAASLTGAESTGLALILEILAEIVAVIAEIVAGIAAILEAPVVVIVAVIALVVWLVYEIIMAIVEAADRALCQHFYEQCVHRRKKTTYCDDCKGECEKAGGIWPGKRCPIPGLFR
ncbi:MAG TPA: DUF4157 domain-containing protein [Pyrinomonadaceae bacterium]|nr:DUF4157 domain-containing protein [Pyrinomonadaceae bacterium]